MQTLIIHGRQPALGRAELESLYGPGNIRAAGEKATVLDIEPKNIDFMRLGGMVKFCKVLTTLDTTEWNDIDKFLTDTTPQHFSALPEGKLKIGFSAYGLHVSVKQMRDTAIKVKKAGKLVGRSIRIIPNKEPALNAAQALHNKLTQKLGWELVFVRDGSQTIIAQSIAVQDIGAYTKRDRGRPYRDAKVGMLPPKLAQTIINLGVNGSMRDKKRVTILDPFCGSGVLLQEALLMGYGALGSDIDRRMMQYSQKNLQWLQDTNESTGDNYHLEPADATSHTWNSSFDLIASETYLGRPLASLPGQDALRKIIDECDEIHEKFLKNIARQTGPGFRMCLAIPAWKTQSGFKHLKTLDKLAQLGYNRVSFEHASDSELVYHRPDQIVARELVVLKRV